MAHVIHTAVLNDKLFRLPQTNPDDVVLPVRYGAVPLGFIVLKESRLTA